MLQTDSLRISLLVMALACLARFAMVFGTAPEVSPDTFTYTTVAENVYEHFCVSRSDPASGLCKPSWGGNQPLPGYSAFVALAWLISGHSILAVLILQSIVAAAAIARFSFAVQAYTRSGYLALGAGGLLAISPLQIGFSRGLLTEALATATTIWVFAELLLSIAEKRLRIISLGIALVSAVFVRTDAIMLCVLAAFVGFYLHPWREALRRGSVLALIVVLPVATWAARSIFEGLPRYPGVAAGYDNDWAAPPGMLRWGTTWIVSESELREYFFPILEGNYSDVEIPARIYSSAGERQTVEHALKLLAQDNGKPVPEAVDAIFAELAAKRRHADPMTVFVVNPVKRSLFIWLTPHYRFAWPITQFDNHDAAEIMNTVESGIGGALAIAKKYPVSVAERLLINGYRFAVLLGFAALLAMSGLRLFAQLRPIIFLAAGYAVLRTAFFTSGLVMPGVEARYMAEALPAMEAACVLGILVYLRGRRERRDNESEFPAPSGGVAAAPAIAQPAPDRRQSPSAS